MTKFKRKQKKRTVDVSHNFQALGKCVNYRQHGRCSNYSATEATHYDGVWTVDGGLTRKA